MKKIVRFFAVLCLVLFLTEAQAAEITAGCNYGTDTLHTAQSTYTSGQAYRSTDTTDPRQILEEAYALGANEVLPYTATLTGTITQITTAYSAKYGNITVIMEVEGCEDMPIKCYRLKGDGVDQLEAGDTITVTGTITNYQHSYGTLEVEFKAGCEMTAWIDADTIVCENHSWVDATCDNPKTCSVCGVTEGDALGHVEYSVNKDIAPTCYTMGLDECFTYCSVCGEELGGGSVVLPLTIDHDFIDGICSVCGISENSTINTYVKVTNFPYNQNYRNGRYLLVYEAGSLALNGSLTTLDGLGNYIGVTINGDTITLDDADADAYFTITAVDSGYTIQSSSGYYIGQTSDASGLVSSTSTAYVNSLVMNSDGDWAVTSSGAYLRYNSDAAKFSYYDSSSYTNQQAVVLYRMASINCDHSYEAYPTHAPRCETFGYTVYECTVCGHRYTEVIEALSHTYDDDFDTDCNVCGYIRKVEPIFDSSLIFVDAPGLSFQDYIGLQVMFNNSVAGDYDSFYVEITQVTPDGVETTTSAGIPYNSTYTYFEQQIVSWSMTEEVTMTLYAVKDGVVYQGASFTASVKDLAMDKIPGYIDSGDMARVKALVDMLNYGAAVQVAYNYNAENLPNADLGEYAEFGTAEDPVIDAVNDITGTNSIKVYSNNISFQDKVEFQFMVKTSALDGKTVKATLAGTDVAVTYTQNGSYTIIRVAATAAHMRDTYTIAVYDADGNAVTQIYNVSVEAYAKSRLDGGRISVLIAVMKYGDAVAAV